jgi:hypothetical protein
MLAIVFVTSLEEQKIVVTDSMKQNPSQKASSRLAIQDIYHHLWNLKIHYRVHSSLLVAPILRQMNPVVIRLRYRHMD